MLAQSLMLKSTTGKNDMDDLTNYTPLYWVLGVVVLALLLAWLWPYKKWYVIIGRLPFDDEDCAYAFHAASLDDAWEQFTPEIYRDSGKEHQLPDDWMDDESPNRPAEGYVIITSTITCGRTKPVIEHYT